MADGLESAAAIIGHVLPPFSAPKWAILRRRHFAGVGCHSRTHRWRRSGALLTEHEYYEAIKALGLKPTGRWDETAHIYEDEYHRPWAVPYAGTLSADDRLETYEILKRMRGLKSGAVLWLLTDANSTLQNANRVSPHRNECGSSVRFTHAASLSH